MKSIAVAVVHHAGCVLVGQRPKGVPLAGLWEFPGGKVLNGETPREAAARECLEEAGLAVDVVQEYGDVVHQYDHGLVRLHFFACTLADRAADPKPPFRWVPRTDLKRYDFPEANAALIERLVGREDDDL